MDNSNFIELINEAKLSPRVPSRSVHIVSMLRRRHGQATLDDLLTEFAGEAPKDVAVAVAKAEVRGTVSHVENDGVLRFLLEPSR